MTEDIESAWPLQALKESHGISAVAVSSLRLARSNIDFDPRYLFVIFDLPLIDAASLRNVNSIRRRLPDAARFFVTSRHQESVGVQRLIAAGYIVPLKAPFWETDAVGEELTRPNSAQKPFSYDVTIINCFIKSTCEVIEYYTGETPKLEKPFLKDGKAAAEGYVTGLTTLKGLTVHGSTSLTCDKNFVNYLATRVIGVSRSRARKDHSVINQVTCEICDQIFGKARTYLQKLGYDFDISLPIVSVAGTAPVFHKALNPVMTIPFSMSKKTFCIEFCLEFCMDQAAS